MITKEIRNKRQELDGYEVKSGKDTYKFLNPDKFVSSIKKIIGEVPSQEGVFLTKQALKLVGSSEAYKTEESLFSIFLEHYETLLGLYQVNGEVKNAIGTKEQVEKARANNPSTLTPGVRLMTANERR